MLNRKKKKDEASSQVLLPSKASDSGVESNVNHVSESADKSTSKPTNKRSVMRRLFRKKKMKQHQHAGQSLATMTTATTATTNTTTTNSLDMNVNSAASTSASTFHHVSTAATGSDESSNKENKSHGKLHESLDSSHNTLPSSESQRTLDRILDEHESCSVSGSSQSSSSSRSHSDSDDDSSSDSDSSTTDQDDTISHSQESSLFRERRPRPQSFAQEKSFMSGSQPSTSLQSGSKTDKSTDSTDEDDDDEDEHDGDTHTYGSNTLENSTRVTSVFGGGGCINPQRTSMSAWDNTWENIVCGANPNDSFLNKEPSTRQLQQQPADRQGTPKRGIASAAVGIQSKNLEQRDTKKDAPPKRKQKLKSDRAQKSEAMLLTRSALSRPFGRTSLPAHIAKNWIIEIASPEFDEELDQWTYNILVQKEEYRERTLEKDPPIASALNEAQTNDFSSIPLNLSSCSSFATANVTRTLKDFVWLEQELQKEFHGSLLLPLLSLALSSGSDWTTAETMDKELFEKGEWDPVKISGENLKDTMNSNIKIDPKLLADWLSDVFNFVRGKGELIFHGRHAVDIMRSEAIEMFLYQTSKPLPLPTMDSIMYHSMDDNATASQWLRNLACRGNGTDLYSKDSNPFNTVLTCITAVANCSIGGGILEENDHQLPGMVKSDSILSRRNQVHVQRNDKMTRDTTISQHSNVIRAQKAAIDHQRENILRAMYRLRILLDHEAMVSGAWKRFAISLSNLFAFEKDIEGCKVGDKIKSSVADPSKFLSKKVVDDSLRILTRQKMDRAIPSLKVLSGMLSALFADFSCTEPSLEAYSEAINFVKDLKSRRDINNPNSLSYCNEMEEALATNESRMQVSLLQLCNSTYIRVARMSWKYFKMESGQAQLLNSAALKLKKKLDGGAVADNDRYNKQEREDDEKELELVQQLLNLGLKKKFKHSPLAGSSSQTDSDNSDHSDYSDSVTEEQGVTDDSTVVNPQVQNALTAAKERVGRWDAEVALAIMEAAGVEDAEVLVEETTRDLRQVRKLAVRLRENVDRCNDAIDMLHDYSFGGCDVGQEATYPANIFRVRDRFFSELAVAFGGSSESLTIAQDKLLSNIGTNMKDLSGWANALDPVRSKDTRKSNNTLHRRCGECTTLYQQIREQESQIFFEKMRQMLHEYELQIERLDNFVFVQCVGIQIEKHFSKQRADALAAWEKKTDITAAITIATRKRLPQVVEELSAKLETLGNNISHTSVKEAKNRHLGSKSLKAELDALARRRFQRLKETSTHKVIEMSKLWAEQEEYSASLETTSLKEVIKEIETIVSSNEDYIRADGGAHLFALTSAVNGSTVGTSTIGTADMPKAW